MAKRKKNSSNQRQSRKDYIPLITAILQALTVLFILLREVMKQ